MAVCRETHAKPPYGAVPSLGQPRQFRAQMDVAAAAIKPHYALRAALAMGGSSHLVCSFSPQRSSPSPHSLRPVWAVPKTDHHHLISLFTAPVALLASFVVV
jgi:hypothetical protein